jgi:pimeloyl-ACP methyl ester carboxylesterase
VITFDGRGNGLSDRPTEAEAYAEDEFATDAIAIMDAMQTERAVIVGFSRGAQRGLLLPAHHPERVQGAVFIGSSYPGGGKVVPAPAAPAHSELDDPATRGLADTCCAE